VIVKKDCRFFLGSKPCVFHKQHGALCERCTHYEPITARILVIKLDSMGDVLRTTSLLPALKKTYPGSVITWITRRESADLLSGNPLIDEILEFETTALPQLLARSFDHIVSLDATKDSAALCCIARGTIKRGFGIDDTGALYPLNQGSAEWFFLGLNDQRKRQNRKSYQEILLDICELPKNLIYPPQLVLDEEEIAAGRAFIAQRGLNPDKPIIGVNTGSGSRWRMKSLPFDALKRLAEQLSTAYQLILLGGKQEQEKNDHLSRLTGVPNSGGAHNLREFAGIINQCSLIITGDTLALHMALALQKKIVAFFGPTSPFEIEMFSLGEKLFPAIDCLSCYRPTCEKNPTCADLISVEDMVNRAKMLLAPL
jgi:heptosyltransferase-2